MKRHNAFLVLLLAAFLAAVPVLPQAAYAVPTSSSSTGSSGGTAPTVSAAGGEDTSGRGDPGGAGDGLGADIENPVAGTAQVSGAGVAVELLLQLLRLMQVAG